MQHVLSNSGLLKLSLFIADWKVVDRKGKRGIILILRHMLATRSSVAACPVVLYVVKRVVLVSFFLSNSNTQSAIYIIIIDIGDFLKQEIQGPAKFSCKSGKDCKFEEPAMNDLINSIFGDTYITLQCQGGECLHYSQVPGYVVSHLFLQQFFSFYLFPRNHPSLTIHVGLHSALPARFLL